MNLFLWYDTFGDIMKHCEFEKEEKYKLFRSVKELLHPTISKKNISDYKIIIEEELLPVRVFYPKRVSQLDKMIIYFHGECKITNCKGKYSEISSDMAKELDRMVLSIDYEDENDLESIYNDVYKTFYYIYNKLIDAQISKENICLMADSTGASMLLSVYNKLREEKCDIGEVILFYPVLSGEYFGKTKYKSIVENNTIDHDLIKKLKNYYKKKNEGNVNVFPYIGNNINISKGLVIVGGVDPLIDEAKEFAEKTNSDIQVITFANHGFLGSKDNEIMKEYYFKLHEFLEEE